MGEPRPFVFINVAITADGKIDTAARQGAAISSPADLERVDQYRASSDAIMVGGQTLLSEDPKLTVKSAQLRSERLARGLPENPMKVGVVSKIEDPDTAASIRTGGNFLNFGPARVVVFTSEQTVETQLLRMRDRGAEVFVMGERRVDLVRAMSQLRALGVERLMLEGGGTLNAELLGAGLVDELYVFIAPLIFGGATAPTLADGSGLTRENAVQLKLLDVQQFDNGLVVRYGVESK
ncbi:MAG: 2,5-diamino-6-(ribosylamino)-4(3H)-pyrimidinone 5-phosphate reductase [Chloroflexia bacterium]|jgi:2,5-diamino-6-(ribosylamino)-4(3H)-pyrimidinone 5'-phosphate reductase|nr:2,5-diamino-6-(ribosylamino)-4(3H)-pyrimidinone 5-phosphate reductase [Chloroflexia bacterium]